MFVAAWLALAAVVEPPAAAADEGVTLSWSAPPECPSLEEVRARVDALLGDREPGAPFVKLDASVTRNATTFTLQMRTETAGGTSTHTLQSPDCRALADGAALVAAVAADPLAVDRSIAADPIGEPELPPDEVVVTPSPPLADPPRPRGRLKLARFALRADGVLEKGMLPRLGFGPIVTAGLIGPQWRVEVGAVVLPPRDHFVGSDHATGAAFGSWGVRVRGCGVPVVKIVEFPLCGGFEGGQMTSRPLRETQQAGDARRGFGLFAFGGGFGISPRPFIALVAGVDGIVALARPRFESTTGVLLHEPGRVGVRATVGLELRVP